MNKAEQDMILRLCPGLCCFVLCPQEECGFVFESDTDTEVIPKLMKYLYDTQVIRLYLVHVALGLTLYLISSCHWTGRRHIQKHTHLLLHHLHLPPVAYPWHGLAEH